MEGSQPLQQVLMHPDRALRDAFDRKSPQRFPVFKTKVVCADSLRYPQGFRLDGDRVWLPKLGWLRYLWSRPVQGVARNVTVSRRGAHWFMAVQTEAEIPASLHPSRSMAGGDLGVVRFLTLSDGTVFRPLNFFAKLARRLAREERRLSRKVKGSRNWLRQKAGITGLHIRIADASSDYLHKVSSAVSKNHAVVVLEELRMANMSASARGTLLAPGCRVRQKGGLNRAILGVGRVRPPAGIQES